MTFLTDQVIAYVTFVLPIWEPLLVVDVLALIVLIFVERLDPRSLIFWITVIVILPFAGIVLFALFRSTIYASRRFGRKSADDQRFLDYIIPQEGEETVMQRSLRELGADVRTKGNLVKLYWERSEILADVRADFDSATESIYIMARRMPHGLDEAMRSLIEKTKQGLDVRIMTSTLWFGRTGGIGKLRKAGAKFCTFHNPLYSAFMKKSAYRNMRSFVVIDGAIAYEGRGAAMRLEGPAAERLERRFRADWLHGSGEDLGVRPVSTPPRQGGVDVQIVQPEHLREILGEALGSSTGEIAGDDARVPAEIEVLYLAPGVVVLPALQRIEGYRSLLYRDLMGPCHLDLVVLRVDAAGQLELIPHAPGEHEIVPTVHLHPLEPGDRDGPDVARHVLEVQNEEVHRGDTQELQNEPSGRKEPDHEADGEGLDVLAVRVGECGDGIIQQDEEAQPNDHQDPEDPPAAHEDQVEPCATDHLRCIPALRGHERSPASCGGDSTNRRPPRRRPARRPGTDRTSQNLPTLTVFLPTIGRPE